MNHNPLILGAIGAILTLGAGGASAADAPAAEKCFGIVKAGKNDCQTAANACAGHSSADGQGDAWIFVPRGTCEKIVGASLAARR